MKSKSFRIQFTDTKISFGGSVTKLLRHFIFLTNPWAPRIPTKSSRYRSCHLFRKKRPVSNRTKLPPVQGKQYLIHTSTEAVVIRRDGALSGEAVFDVFVRRPPCVNRTIKVEEDPRNGVTYITFVSSIRVVPLRQCSTFPFMSFAEKLRQHKLRKGALRERMTCLIIAWHDSIL